jgi:hypothetical protein
LSSSKTRADVTKRLASLVERGYKLYKDLDADSRDGKFIVGYQAWYTATLPLVRALAPDRVDEFEDLYRTKGRRSKVSLETYRISDWLVGLSLLDDKTEKLVAGLTLSQVLILQSLEERASSRLTDIMALLQYDLFDHELDAASYLASGGHLRAAGAVAGVVLESHLGAICTRHSISLGRKKHSISTLNDALRDGGIIDVPVWRTVQSLADIRNLCDHRRERDPTPKEVSRLVDTTRQLLAEIA